MKIFKHDQSTNEHHQISDKYFAKLPSKGICDPLKKLSNFSQPISPAKSIFQPIWAIFRGHHTPHGTHSSEMHSTIQYPNLHSSTIMQHNQRNTPVIMHPSNIFILQHLKLIPIFIQPCSTKIPFMSLCHIKISQTWYLARANHMLHHKSFKYHTEITFKTF